MTVTVRTARRSRANQNPLKEARLTLFPRDGNHHARGTICHAGLIRSVQGDDGEFQRQAVETRILFDTNLTRERPGDDGK